MKKHWVWIEIVALVTAIACALAVLIATLGAAAGAAVTENGGQNNSTAEQTFEGMVTCSRCGAKHSAALARTATTCTRVCVHGGASFELVQAESAYLLEGGSDALTRVAGERASIVGIRHGNTIKVASVLPGAS